MVVILDDSPHVWINYENYVIKVKRYFFFKDTTDMNLLHGKKRKNLDSKETKKKKKQKVEEDDSGKDVKVEKSENGVVETEGESIEEDDKEMKDGNNESKENNGIKKKEKKPSYYENVDGTDLTYFKNWVHDDILALMLEILKRVHEKYYEDEGEIGNKDCGV